MSENVITYLGGDHHDNNPHVRPLIDRMHTWFRDQIIPNIGPKAGFYQSPDCTGFTIEPHDGTGIGAYMHPEGRACISRWRREVPYILGSATVSERSQSPHNVQRSLQVHIGATDSSMYRRNSNLYRGYVFKEVVLSDQKGVECVDEVTRSRIFNFTDIGGLEHAIDVIKLVAVGELGLKEGYQQMFVDQAEANASIALHS